MPSNHVIIFKNNIHKSIWNFNKNITLAIILRKKKGKLTGRLKKRKASNSANFIPDDFFSFLYSWQKILFICAWINSHSWCDFNMIYLCISFLTFYFIFLLLSKQRKSRKLLWKIIGIFIPQIYEIKVEWTWLFLWFFELRNCFLCFVYGFMGMFFGCLTNFGSKFWSFWDFSGFLTILKPP